MPKKAPKNAPKTAPKNAPKIDTEKACGFKARENWPRFLANFCVYKQWTRSKETQENHIAIVEGRDVYSDWPGMEARTCVNNKHEFSV